MATSWSADDASYLAALIAARTAILAGKSYTIGNRSLQRADEQWISSEIARLELRYARSTRGVSSVPVFTSSR